MKIKGESTVLFPPKRISNFSTLCVKASLERFDDRSGDFFWGVFGDLPNGMVFPQNRPVFRNHCAFSFGDLTKLIFTANKSKIPDGLNRGNPEGLFFLLNWY
jgi:hypothetical protein